MPRDNGVIEHLQSRSAYFSRQSSAPRSYSIPNWLTLGIAAAYYAFAVCKLLPLSLVLAHTGIALALMIAMVLFADLGGGVTKLTAAIILWLGFWPGITFFALSYFPCGIGALLMTSPPGEERRAPYAPFAVAAVAVMAWFGLLPPELRF